MCSRDLIFHNDHNEAVAHYSEPFVAFMTVSAAGHNSVALFTCRHCSHSWTLQVEVQMEAALKQALRVLRAAVAPVWALTCGLCFLRATRERWNCK